MSIPVVGSWVNNVFDSFQTRVGRLVCPCGLLSLRMQPSVLPDIDIIAIPKKPKAASLKDPASFVDALPRIAGFGTLFSF
jgi:hypothetical protein